MYCIGKWFCVYGFGCPVCKWVSSDVPLPKGKKGLLSEGLSALCRVGKMSITVITAAYGDGYGAIGETMTLWVGKLCVNELITKMRTQLG